MNGSLPAANMRSDEACGGDLLSVDTDAHLQKLAACMFPTPAQLPVELVRAALKRGATAIDIRLQRRKIVIHDNGNGIGPGQWQALACAFDSGREAADREIAIASLQSEASPGIGLLAVRVPGSRGIRIESAASGGGMTLHIADGQVRLTGSRRTSAGTLITISRGRSRLEAEKRLVRELCASAPAEIVLNGRKLERKTWLRRTLAQQQVGPESGGNPFLVAVPAQGDTCRIWLLDQGIPWQVLTSASYHGLVFEASLESVSPPTAEVFGMLAAAAGRLYQWLAEHYLSFPEKFQVRIEELVFKKARLAGDLHLLSAFTPFRVWRSKQRLNLEEVRRKAEKNVLLALPYGSDPGAFLGRHLEVLLLTPQQKDFLLNHLHVPLVTPAVPRGAKNRWAGIFFSCRQGLARLTARLPRRRIRILAPGQMSGEEKRLCREMESHWRRLQHRDAPAPHSIPLTVLMVEGRGQAPAFWRPRTQDTVLFLRRRHPLVCLALQSLSRDPDNIELAFSALAPEHFLTAVGH